MLSTLRKIFKLTGTPLQNLNIRTCCINIIRNKMAQKLTEMKLCPDCNIEKADTEFITANRKIPRCKECQNILRCKKRKEAKANAINITKICKNCNTEKKGSEFEFGTLLCKPCFSEKEKEENNRPSETDPDKTCRICEVTKSAIQFRKKELTCKECSKKKLYEWRENNKEQFLNLCKKYRDKDESKALRNKNRREKYKKNIQDRLLQIYRNRVRFCVKKKDFPKNTHIDYEKLVGIKWDILINWLEYNFKPEMNWDNYGTYWHIDHIYPCSLFDFSIEENRYKCFNWTNLAPLKGIDNIKKSNKLDIDMIQYYRKQAINFIQQNSNIQITTDVLPDDIKILVTSGALTTKDTVKAVSGSGEKSEVW
jgi:hypothetical protein